MQTPKVSFDLKSIAEKAGKEPLCIVKDGPVRYFVLNEKANLWTPEKIIKANELLDQIEADEEAGLLVSLSANPKFLSAGFDFNFLMKEKTLSGHMLYGMSKLLSRFLTLNLPTLCVS
jgi:enoyl-CoA hydratase/carnithine racemase